LWVSGGSFNNELSALNGANEVYGKKLADLVVGIAVGSEDLYRAATPSAGAGATPSEIVSYIKQVRDSIKGSVLDGVPIGHVDLSSAWTNSSNSAVIDACDFLGVNIYPYYEESGSNRIEDAKSLFEKAADATLGAARNKPVWITETGWPVRGGTYRDAVPSTSNAEKYWEEVGCSTFGVRNTWWFTLESIALSSSTAPDFAILDTNSNAAFDLSCPIVSSTTSGTSRSSSVTSSSSTGSSSRVSQIFSSRIQQLVLRYFAYLYAVYTTHN
jgi:glucan endo-1,3-beta-D-glucosidase